MITISHLALFVSDLRRAESFYRRLFEMQLIMREAEQADGRWYTLPPDKGWDDAETAGIALDMVALRRDAFVLALFRGKPDPRRTVLEIGVSMPAGDIAAVRGRLPDTVNLVYHEYGDLMFDDPFGYRWHLWLEGEVFRSNGESAGRWLEL